MDLDTKARNGELNMLSSDILKGDVVVGAIGGEEARQGTVCETDSFHKQRQFSALTCLMV